MWRTMAVTEQEIHSTKQRLVSSELAELNNAIRVAIQVAQQKWGAYYRESGMVKNRFEDHPRRKSTGQMDIHSDNCDLFRRNDRLRLFVTRKDVYRCSRSRKRILWSNEWRNTFHGWDRRKPMEHQPVCFAFWSMRIHKVVLGNHWDRMYGCCRYLMWISPGNGREKIPPKILLSVTQFQTFPPLRDAVTI